MVLRTTFNRLCTTHTKTRPDILTSNLGIGATPRPLFHGLKHAAGGIRSPSPRPISLCRGGPDFQADWWGSAGWEGQVCRCRPSISLLFKLE